MFSGFFISPHLFQPRQHNKTLAIPALIGDNGWIV